MGDHGGVYGGSRWRLWGITGAVYPVRIDPTLSDADWVSLNAGITGANNSVLAMVVDGSGSIIVKATDVAGARLACRLRRDSR